MKPSWIPYHNAISKYFDMPHVTEFVINKPHEVFIESNGVWSVHNDPILSYDFLMGLSTVAASLSNSSINSDNPMLSATLPTGERAQIVIPPATPEKTISITIRKASSVDFSLSDLKTSGLFDDVVDQKVELTAGEKMLIQLKNERKYIEFIDLAVKEKQNIVISGATGSGKTTLAKAIIHSIPLEERIITIEDVREIQLPHANVVHLLFSKDKGVNKSTPQQLLESCLRMKPDRILLSELRGDEAFDYLRNVGSGHPGSITTVHANNAEHAFDQLSLLIKLSVAGSTLARDDIMRMLYALVNVVIQVKNVNGKRRITEIYYEPSRKIT